MAPCKRTGVGYILDTCKVRSQPSAALQEQLVRASRAGQVLSCAKARPMLLAASQRAFWLRPPAISRRDMMTGGGSAVKRLIFSITLQH